MEREKLVFIIVYPSLKKEIRVLAETDSNQNNIYIKIEENFKVVGIYKMIIWQGGRNKRVYIHNRLKTYTQVGYMNIKDNEIESFNLIQNYKMEPVTGYIFRLVHIYLFNIDKWTFPNMVPINVNLEKIEIPTNQVNHIKVYTEMIIVILNKFKELVGLGREKQSIEFSMGSTKKIKTTVENDIVQKTSKKADIRNDEITSNKHIGCSSCKYRKECIRKSKVNGSCNDFIEGAAITDYTQWG